MPDRIDENPINDGEWQSAYPVPSTLFEAAIAQRDRLADIIDRAAEVLRGPAKSLVIEIAADQVARGRRLYLAEDTRRSLASSMLSIVAARAVLAEAEPEDPGR